ATFRGLSPAQQDRIRQLDKQLHELDAATETRLWAVMERYAGWLARLPAEDRQKIESTPAGPERLKAVDQILDRRWQEALPRPDRERLTGANPEEREQILGQMRKEEADRRKQRAEARRAVEEAAAQGPSMSLQTFREALRHYVDESLRPLLSPDEEARLNT